ncbi:MAG: VWA domain-containing protein [Vicinamibacteria bacterium]
MTARAVPMRVALALVAAIGAVAAAAARPATAEEGERRAVLVSVTDERGSPVTGLTATSFFAESHGRPITIVSATPDRASRRVGVLVDTSGSQAISSPWKAVEELVEALVPANRVALLTLDITLRVHSELTSDAAELRDAIRGARTLRAEGPSALYAGARLASRGFGEPALGDTLCFFTDGEDTASTSDLREMVTAIARRGVRVFVVRTAEGRPRFARDGIRDESTRWIAAMTKATGGGDLSLDQVLKDGGVHALATRIEEGYRLDLLIPKSVGDSADWRLQVVGQDGKKLPKVRVTYPEILPAPASR